MLLYWGTVVNDQGLLTTYLLGITSSVAVDALWQLSCTPNPQVLLRHNDEKLLVKRRNTSSSQTLASSLPTPSWHILMFCFASNTKRISQELCSYCKAYFPMKERGYSLPKAVGTSNHRLTLIWQEDTRQHTNRRTTWERDKLPLKKASWKYQVPTTYQRTCTLQTIPTKLLNRNITETLTRSTWVTAKTTQIQIWTYTKIYALESSNF